MFKNLDRKYGACHCIGCPSASTTDNTFFVSVRARVLFLIIVIIIVVVVIIVEIIIITSRANI